MFAIAGVSGHTGHAVASALLAKGQRVRVIVRDARKAELWKTKGAEVAVADLGDSKALGAALTGVEGAYLLLPPNAAAADMLADRAALVARMAEAVRAAKLPALVFLSSVGAQLPAGTGPIVIVHRAERELGDSAPSVTFVRAAYFLENWASVLGPAREQGVLPHYGAVDVKFSQVCALDIGEAVAEALTHPVAGSRIIELAGREDWSVQDVASELGRLWGKRVNAVSVPVERAKADLQKAGLPDASAGLLAEMYAAFASGSQWEQPQRLARGKTTLADALKTFAA
jgi:NAD(P)H dehydrogenase (quinone)